MSCASITCPRCSRNIRVNLDKSKDGRTHCSRCNRSITYDSAKRSKYRKALLKDPVIHEREKAGSRRYYQRHRQEKLARDRLYYQANRTRHIQHSVERRRRLRLKHIAALGGRCMRCNLIGPVVIYDLHHTTPGAKDRLNDWLRENIDYAKYQLLCSNCHRIFHHANGDESDVGGDRTIHSERSQ